MAFLRATTPFETPVIQGAGLFLRTPSLADYPAWTELRAESRAFLTPWEPTWPADDLTRTAFRRRIRRYQAEIREDHAYPFFIFRQTDYALLGGITLSNVTRGMTQTATTRLLDGRAHAGRGYMTRAVRALAPFAFSALQPASAGGRLPAAQRRLDAAPGKGRLPARGAGARPRLHQRPLAGPHRLRAACARTIAL